MIFIECTISQSRRILSILMIIFLLVVVVANSSTKPIYYGNKVHLLCTYEKPISRCRFVLPDETLEIELFENRNLSSEKYVYFGKGFKAGECGITIENVTSENQGDAICILTDNYDFDHLETVQVKIFDFNNLHTSLPKMKILNSGPLKVSQTLAVECVTKNIDQYSNISWLLNDRILNNSDIDTIQQFKNVKDSIFELKSTLKHQLEMLDNGRTLKCRTRISNYSQEFIDTTIDLEVSNETRKPIIGLPFDISIKFFSYPRPTSSRWKVNKRIIYYGNAIDEFKSKELKYLGNNEWEAVLYIKNITDQNIHYNYSLQITDSEGTKNYDVRLDDSINETDPLLDESTRYEEETTASQESISIGENSITSSPKIRFTKQQQQHQQQQLQRGEKTNTFRRTTRYSHYHHSIHPFVSTERRIKHTRKQQKNTSIAITEMTSVTSTSTTTQSNIIIIDTTKAHTNETTAVPVVIENEKSFKNVEYNVDENSTLKSVENEMKEIEERFNTTTSKNLIENITIEDPNEKTISTQSERLFIRISFVTMVLIIITFFCMLCHYRRQVTILKTEIIQMNLENYYNQSCLYPSTFNNYTSTNFQQNDGVPFYIKRPLNANSNNNNTSSGDSDISSTGFLSTYNTNSHLYQSIDADDIDNHVYDEIIQTRENDEEKPNNYENNESFNNINEMLIPSHCHTLMTIHEEEEEFEASQIQILSNLESTYI